MKLKSQFSQEMEQRIERSAVIAVLVIDQVEHAVAVARALLAGGIDVMELTLRTPVAIDSLVAIRQEVPEMLTGIGTILTTDQVADVVAAGGAFGVSPGLNPEVIRNAQEVGLPFAPGIATPTELEQAIGLGCRDVKLFPAELMGGLQYLKSIGAPYRHLGARFIPLGGINPENMLAYLEEPSVLALGGSWLAPQQALHQEDWGAVERLAAETRQRANLVRG